MQAADSGQQAPRGCEQIPGRVAALAALVTRSKGGDWSVAGASKGSHTGGFIQFRDLFETSLY